MADLGLTHIALAITDTDASVDFYARFAGLEVVHRRPAEPATLGDVVWLADGRRPFVLVLIPQPSVEHPLGGPLNHLGVAVESRAAVDEAVSAAEEEGFSVSGPMDYPPPVGYWAIISDPDGHSLELSFGQEVGVAAASN